MYFGMYKKALVKRLHQNTIDAISNSFILPQTLQAVQLLCASLEAHKVIANVLQNHQTVN